MQIKSVFISALAIGSAAANVLPVINRDSMKAQDGGVEARYYSTQCSPGYQWEHNACQSICGDDGSASYDLDTKKCVCKNDKLRFNNSARKCDCGPGNVWDDFNKKCVEACCSGATLEKGNCKCVDPAQKYENKKCVPRCAAGSKWDGSKCTTSCEPGTKWDDYGNKCVSICLLGEKWENNKCVSSCKPDEKWENNKCVPACKPGAKLESNKCVPACRPDEKWENNKCVPSCKPDEKWENNKCVPSCRPDEKWENNKCAPACKPGEKWEANKCIPSCKPDEKWENNKCVHACKPEEKWENNKCVPACKPSEKLENNKCIPACKPGEKWEANKCIPDCKPGQKRDKDNNCVPDCKPGEKLDKDKCVPDCKPGEKLDKDKCVPDCKPGEKWEANKCIPDCKPGEKLDKDKCVPDCKPGEKLDKDKCVPACKPGEKWEANKCIPDCKPGEKLDKDKCVPDCKPGQKLEKGKCVPDCRPGEKAENDKCVPMCNDGAAWKNNACECPKPCYDYIKSKCVLNCGQEAYPKDGQCICKANTQIFDVVTKKCACEKDTEWNKLANKCVPICGKEARYEARSDSCVCDVRSKVWEKGVCACPKDRPILKKNECVPDCGSTAWWDSGKDKCICNKQGQEYNKEKGCGCFSDNEVYDEDRRKCVTNCGDSAQYSPRAKDCVCNNPKLDYDKATKTCACAEGFEPKGKACVPKCPRDSEYVKAVDQTPETCRCTKGGYVYNKDTKACDNQCPKDADWEIDRCVCRNKSYVVGKDKKCGCPEGSVPAGRGECKPSCKNGADWSVKDNRCICKEPNTKYTDAACVCDEGYAPGEGGCQPKCPKSADWKVDTCVCKNSQYKFYQSEDGGKGRCRCPDDTVAYGPNGKFCKTDCGKFADWKDNKCECKAKNTDYVKKDEPCKCKDGYTMNNIGECRPTCPGNADYVPASGNDKATCKCRGDGLEYVESLNACKSKCPNDATFVKGSGQVQDTCECKVESKKFVDGRCEPKCPSDATYTPKNGQKAETCTCKSELNTWDGSKCKPKCPEDQKAMPAENPQGYTCKCTDESKKLDNGVCKPKCPQDQKVVPALNPDGYTCQCTDDSKKIDNGVCKPKCPEDQKATPAENPNGYTCKCTDDSKKLDNGVCKPKCPEDQKAIPAENPDGYTCKCTDDSKKLDKGVCKPKCPQDQKVVPALNPDGYTCQCTDDSKKLDNGVCKPKCPEDQKATPAENPDGYTCKCTDDSKKLDNGVCKPKCPGGQKPVLAENPQGYDCECTDISKKIENGECKNKCPDKSSYVPKNGNNQETCKCDNVNLQYLDKTCKCPANTEPRGQSCIPICAAHSTYQVGKGCVCDDVNASLSSAEPKTCQCNKGFEPNGSNKCISKCCEGATFVEGINGAEDTCKCKNEEYVYDKVKKTCDCPPNTEKLGPFCKPICPKGAVVNILKKPWKCECVVEGSKVVGEGAQAECKCPPEAPRAHLGKCVACPTGSSLTGDGKSCKCEAGKFVELANKCLCDNLKEPKGGKCDPDCGRLAKPDDAGVCKCNLKNALFKDADKSCPCPPGSKTETINREPQCVCNQNELKGSVFNSDKTACVCPDGQVKDGNCCVPKCEGNFVLNGDKSKCICPSNFKEVGNTCLPICVVPSTSSTVCWCDTAVNDVLEQFGNKCVKKCDPGYVHEPNNADGTCVCDTTKNGGPNCLPKCPIYTPNPNTRRTPTSLACYCDETQNKFYSDGNSCVPKCEKPGYEHNLAPGQGYKCLCNPSTHTEVTVDGQTTCVKNCALDPPQNPVTKRITTTTEACFCDPKYEQPETGICFTPCPIANEKHVKGSNNVYTCTCPSDYKKDTDSNNVNFCKPYCNDNELIDTRQCFCDSSNKFDDNGTCKPLCTEAEDVAKPCHCPVGSDWEIKKSKTNVERCVNTCKNGKLHDENDENLACVCPEATHFWDEQATTCTPLCTEAEDVSKPCHCPVGNDWELKKSKTNVERCVSTCKNGKLHDENDENLACVCPESTHFWDEQANACTPLCTQTAEDISKPCHCPVGSDWEIKKSKTNVERCVNTCKNGKMHDENDENLACVCPEATHFWDEQATTCTPLCTEPAEDVSKPCHCPVGNDWEIKKSKTNVDRCVNTCKNGKLHDENDENLACVCPESTHYWDQQANTCTPLCAVDTPTNPAGGQSCYCKAPLVKQGGFCVNACTKKNAQFNSAQPPKCVCKPDYHEVGEYCYAACGNGDVIDGPNGCFCDTANPSWERYTDGKCYKTCANTEKRDPASKLCQCKTDAFKDGPVCKCPPQSTPKETACVCDDPNKEVYDKKCVDKCPSGSTRYTGPDPSQKGKCVCVSPFVYDDMLRKCACPFGRFREGTCRDKACPGDTFFDFVASKCVCTGSRKVWNENQYRCDKKP